MTVEQILDVSIPLAMVGVLLAGVGQAIGTVIGDSQHRAALLWQRTRALHPIAVGMLLGLSSLPVPEPMGDGLMGRLVWYGSAGVLSALIYEWVRAVLEKRAKP